MPETCEICGTTEEIQEHHISYEPEIKQFLCVTCHQKKHGHGVGKAKGWTTKVSELLRIDAKMLFKEGATNGEVAKTCGICYATASHWRKKLGHGLPNHTEKLRKLIKIYTEKGKVVRLQKSRRIALSKSFCEKKGIEEGDWVLIEKVEKVEIEVRANKNRMVER